MWEAAGNAVPERLALVDDSATRTYAEPDDEPARVTSGLAGLGVRPGHPVAFDSRPFPMASTGGPQSASRIFSGTHDQIAQARAFAKEILGTVPVLDDVVLLVSELCANAVLHTASGDGGKFEVVICRSNRQVRVEVRDDGSERQPVISPPGLAAVGRGLQLVAALAEYWGYRGDRNGRTVYFQMRW